MRLFHTVRHLRLKQILARIRYTSRRRRRFQGGGKHLDAFQSHYFEGEFTKADVHAWIETHKEKIGEAWDPYTISVRVPHWLRYADDPVIQASIRKQLEFLANNIEHDIGGNHVIKNLRALILGNVEADRAMKLLRHEVKEQILEDGGHIERTPMYHLEVLNDLRDINAPELRDKIAKMET
ncbi:MAG TPA: heparinase II/III family protein, partial [Thermoanaerobaculia bacterium]|nr:heparinase II/III family protein [Thermoanaerobaculia bacterium]